MTAFSLPFSKRSASAATLEASVPGTGGGSMPIRRIARRRGPLGESSAAKSHTHAAIRPPGRATRRISDIARALLGTKFMTSADATTSKDASGNGNSCASASRNSAFLGVPPLRAWAICASAGSTAITDAGAHESQISSVKIPVPQPTSSQCAPAGRLQPSEEGLADLAAPAAHELLVGLAVIKAVWRHRLLRANIGRSYERPVDRVRTVTGPSGRPPSPRLRWLRFLFGHEQRTQRVTSASDRFRARPASREPL